MGVEATLTGKTTELTVVNRVVLPQISPSSLPTTMVFRWFGSNLRFMVKHPRRWARATGASMTYREPEVQPRRLNLVWSTLHIGGSERRMVEAVPEMVSRGLHVKSFVVADGSSLLESELIAAGSEVLRSSSFLAAALRVARSPAAVTWTFGLRAALPVRLVKLCRPLWDGGKLWSAQNGLEATRGKWVHLADRLTSRTLNLVVANSYAAADYAVRQVGVPPDRVEVVCGALPHEWNEPRKRVSRDDVVVAMVGNARKEKQHKLGLDVFKNLADPLTSLRVYSNKLGELQNSTLDSELTRISFHENERVTPDTFAEIDVLLHPSSSESLPRAALEARSQDVWVVGFDVGDLGTYTNVRVPLGDSDGLLEALRAAVSAVRAGQFPDKVHSLTVSDYVDRIIELGYMPRTQEG